MKREFFTELYNSHFLKTRINAFFHMWSLQEGGGEPFTVNAFLMQFYHLFQRGNSSKKPQSLLQEKCHCTEHTQAESPARGEEQSWSHQEKTGRSGRGRDRTASSSEQMSQNVAFIQEKSDTSITSLLCKSDANTNFPHPTFKALLPQKNMRLLF